jgi:transketolase
VLSAGHGSMLLYALLHLTGYEDMTIDEICNASASSARKPPAIPNTASGRHRDDHRAARPGLATAVGMALAERLLATPPSATRWSTTAPMCWPATAA